MNYRIVTRDEFFAFVNQRNVHPRPEREYTEWVDQNNRIVGMSTPGYLHPEQAKTYSLVGATVEAL